MAQSLGPFLSVDNTLLSVDDIFLSVNSTFLHFIFRYLVISLISFTLDTGDGSR